MKCNQYAITGIRGGSNGRGAITEKSHNNSQNKLLRSLYMQEIAYIYTTGHDKVAKEYVKNLVIKTYSFI